MKIVCVSDTHLREGIEVPDGDVLVHAGDGTMGGDFFEVREWLDWLRALPHRRKVFIAGNHDYLFEKAPDLARSLIAGSGLIYLQDSGVTIDGVTFYGAPWQPRFHDWAFNLDRGAELAAKWALIPNGVDVLVTHGPPYGILDYSHFGDAHVGCKDLLAAVQRIKPRVHIFGHIHAGYGQRHRNGTTFINAAICDEAYRPTHTPIVVEL